jgi:YNFM family putative membrane transporter
VLWVVLSVMLAGLLLTLSNSLAMILIGMAMYTFGFFASHSVASSWVGRRARAPKALASALYLFFYYLGSSVIGWLCGYLWSHGGWPGVVALLGSLLCVGLLIALRLRKLIPIAAPPVALAASA